MRKKKESDFKKRLKSAGKYAALTTPPLLIPVAPVVGVPLTIAEGGLYVIMRSRKSKKKLKKVI